MFSKKTVLGFGVACTAVVVPWLAGCSSSDEAPVPRHEHDRQTVAFGPAITPFKVAHPQAGVHLQGDRVRRVYGVVATGKTPQATAESFRRASAPAFGVEPADLAPAHLGGPRAFKGGSGAHAVATLDGVGLMYDRATRKHKFRLFVYRQQRDGVPVFRAGMRTLVREGDPHPLVWANADLRPMGSFQVQARAVRDADLDKSLRALAGSAALGARSLPVPAALTDVSAPTPTIFAGVGAVSRPPRMAMEYTARAADGRGKWTFVADAETGDVLHVESNLHFDVNGSVTAEVTLGSESAECGVLDVVPLAHATVTSSAGNVTTDENGAFTIAQPGTASVHVTSSVSGEYFVVNNGAGEPASLSLEVVPPGPASFLHRDEASPPELVLAQLNAYKHASDLREMLLGYLPEYPVIAGQTSFPINVNHNDILCEATGGAWYDDDSAIRSLNFCQRTAERSNTAFGSIVHHEYGHHIVDSGGSAQNEYGEGMADTIAMLFSKDPNIAVGYQLNRCDLPLRNAASDCRYDAAQCSSCGAGLYECGSVLSGTIWDIWQALDATEPENADDIIRSLVFSSIPMHTGDEIDAAIAVDLLTLDDDDDLIENGTPHYAEICAGFEQHGMSCPPLLDGLVVKGTDLDAEGPSDGPFAPESISYTLHNLGPEPTLTYSVTTPPGALWLNVDPGDGTIALGETATVTLSIDQAAAALLTDGDYDAEVQFVNETSGLGSVSRLAELRVGAPVPVYTATFDDDLEGFTADSEPGNLWHRSTACIDALPGHTAPGNLHYGRDDRCNFETSTPIAHTVTSPAIAIDNPSMAELGFNYYLATEDNPNYDNAAVLVSVDGGPFQVVASNQSDGVDLEETTAWTPLRVDIAELLPASGPTSIRVQFSFNAVDPNSNVDAGFAIDDLTVYAKPCETEGGCAPSEPDAFIETNGSVVFEAEHFTENTQRSAHGWTLLSQSQASGQALMSARPNYGDLINQNFAATSPELTYPVRFTTTGTYYVWLRGSGATANDDSCHVGLNGAEVASADRITGFGTSLSWTRSTMDGPVATVRVTAPGVHDVNMWMREDGLSLDKIVLTTNPTFRPSGVGPNESESGGSTQRPCAAYCQHPISFSSNNHQSGNLGTAPSCHETTAPLAGLVCGNLASPRRLFVNGVPMPCNWTPVPSLPARVNGGYCIHTTGGDYAWAAFATW